jgi:1-pyrroline-5-carboxylate dehydrogenase
MPVLTLETHIIEVRMQHHITSLPRPANEPVRNYAPGSNERQSLQQELQRQQQLEIEIPALIGGAQVHTGNSHDVVMPHCHQHRLAVAQMCGKPQVEQAVACAREAWLQWNNRHWEDRVAVFLRAADLLAGPWRDRINAATMLGQSKTCQQAEIDAACEMIDFFRFNCHFMTQIYADQPHSSAGLRNRVEYRALEGFVLAVTPFNFTAIGGNLPVAPALLGNVVLWKPASTQLLSAWYTMQVLQEAGLPPGVINLLPGHGADVGDPAIANPQLAVLHFTGSTGTFQHLWRSIGNNISSYRSYPRIVGETGGKDYILALPDAATDVLVTALLRGAFEYQGQKCSAASRAYIPASRWDEVVDKLLAEVGRIRMGDPADFSNFMAAVIDAKAFASISGYIEHARTSTDHRILAGGGCDDSVGYFIEPTVVQADQADSKLMLEEIFGPVLTLHRYSDQHLEQLLDTIDDTSVYALTGAIITRDRMLAAELCDRLRHTAGNFYINDKPTGAVVGQQPFGGGRASGTNDKAGSIWNLIRWASPRAIKETFDAPTDWSYPHMRK